MSGEIIIGANGEIVWSAGRYPIIDESYYHRYGEAMLADDLYPMHAKVVNNQIWRRSAAHSTAPDKPNYWDPVWWATWAVTTDTNEYAQLQYQLIYEGGMWRTIWSSMQTVRKITLAGIDWDRVLDMKVSYILQWSYTATPLHEIPARFLFGTGDGIATPSGNKAPWTVNGGQGWQTMEAFNMAGGTEIKHGVATVVGCKGVLWFASYFDVGFMPAEGHMPTANTAALNSFAYYQPGVDVPIPGAHLWPRELFTIRYNLKT